MKSSPWAKLTTSMMPKIRVRPEATRARIIPVTMPLTVWMTMRSHGIAMAQTPRYWWMTGSSTLSSEEMAWWRTSPFSMK